MKPITIFRHTPSEGPGYFGEFLERQQIPYRVIAVDAGEAIPSTLDETSALVFMGGPMSVNDPLPWIEPELALIRMAIESNMPVLGHCLGGQLISKALGGTVTANPVKEFGWIYVTQQNSGVATSWLSALPPQFPAFHWHGETFSIPAGAELILSSAYCRNQAFVIGNTLALQCHVEMTAAMVREWAGLHAAEIANATPSIQTWRQMSEGLEARVQLLQGYADQLYLRWLQPLLAANND